MTTEEDCQKYYAASQMWELRENLTKADAKWITEDLHLKKKEPRTTPNVSWYT